MTVYGVVLHAHGWWRWAVLVLGVATLVQLIRSRSDQSALRPSRLHRTFIGALDVQFMMGLALYVFLSPPVRAGWSDIGGAIGTPVIRFYTIEHVVGMVVAVGIAHLGFSALSRGMAQDGGRARSTGRALAAQVVWLLVTLASIPWPVFEYGRPLLRPFF